MERLKRIRVVLIDDHTIFREGMISLFQAIHDIDIVGEAADGAEGIDLIERERPNVALLDINMPGLNGIDAGRIIIDRFPRVSVVILTAYDYVQYVREVVRMGAKGYLLKTASVDEIAAGIRKAHTGEPVLDPSITKQLFEAFGTHGTAQFSRITPRELEVLALIADGLSNAVISERLFITQKTVETHIGSILSKLGASNRTEPVRTASELGLVAGERLR